MGVEKKNVIMFPFMAQGHIIPFLALAHEIEKQQNCTITFVNTRLNIQKLKPIIPPNSCIRLVEIPFDSTQFGLPPNIENTDSLPPHLMLHFFKMCPAFRPAFTKIVSDFVRENEGVPLCIISDMFFGWSAKVAHEFGAFHAVYNAGGGYGMAALFSVLVHLPHHNTTSFDFPLPGFPQGYTLHRDQVSEHLKATKIGDHWHRYWQQMVEEWKESDGILFNTIEEMETVGLGYFRNTIGCPVWPIGPILSSLGSKARGGEEARETTRSCMKWLDSKPEQSVLYIAFGSQSALSSTQMTHMALALESSSINFIWVVRSPSDPESCIKEGLPENFEQNMKENDRGIILHKWAPQMEILSHKSIAVFLTHCGWNSTLEALTNGVPMLSWPMGAEQHFNAKMLEEEMGVCVTIGNAGNEIEHEVIKEKIELVMGGTSKGKKMKNKVCEVKEMLIKAREDENGCKGSSAKNMDVFLEAAFLNSSALAINKQ